MPKQLLSEPEGIDTLAGPEEDFFPEIVERPVQTDPELIPGTPQWKPKRFFGLQQKFIVLIPKNDSDMLSDPSGRAVIKVPVSIQGYRLDITKGVPTKVPQDFAEHIVRIGAGIMYSTVTEAQEV